MPIDNDNGRRKKLNELSYRVLGHCLEVHRNLGPGLLESVYEAALAHELRTAGIRFECQRNQSVDYKGLKLDCGYRLDFLIEDELVLELKAVHEVLPIHRAQLQTYLKLGNCPLGLLVNFNAVSFKEGVTRLVSGDLFRSTTDDRKRFIRLFLLCIFVSSWFTRTSATM